MGVGYVDVWSIGHFSFGAFSQALIQTTGVSTAFNFIIANYVHLFIELFEKDVKFGKLSQSFENHITDIIFFFLGWLLSYITNSAQYIPRGSLPILWTMLVLSGVKDILIEIYIEENIQIETIYAIFMICSCILIGFQYLANPNKK
jgi:hypothetical protein